MEERHMVDTEVGKLAVRVIGRGVPAVLWHSLFVDERSWQRLENQFAETRRLILITGPGHGASPDPGHRYTLENCAAAARTVLNILDVNEPVDWVGNAWGGHVGVVFAAHWPSRCKTLVTLGAPIQALNRVERARTMALLLAYRIFGHAGFVEDGVVKVLLSPKTRTQDLAAVELVKDCLANANPAALRNAVHSISLRRADLTPYLPEILAPTLFITGRDHEGWTPQQATAASRGLRHGSAAVVTDAAYLIPLEAPGETANLVRQFWTTNASTSPSDRA